MWMRRCCDEPDTTGRTDDADLDEYLASVGATREDLNRNVEQLISTQRRMGHGVEVRYDRHGRVSALRLRDA
jgi:hypothetical protein